MSSVTSSLEELELRNSLVDVCCSHFLSRCVYVVCELGIPDLLKNGSKSSSELALLTGSDESYMLRILRVSTASAGIFRQDGKTFELTPKGCFLTSDHPHSLRSFVLMLGHEVFSKSLDNLSTCVTQGRMGLEVVYNKPLYIPLFEEMGLGGLFGEAMKGYSSMHIAPIANALEISARDQSIVDIAGGTGNFLAAVLRAHPTIKTGELFEIAPVIERAGQSDTPISELVQEGRAVLQVGDMFATDSIPRGRDAYLLQHIIIDYTDELLQVLLGNIFQAMKGGPKTSRLIIVDHFPTEKHGYSHMLDIMQMVQGGTMRTMEEMKEVLSKIGFTAPQVTTVPGLHDKFILSANIRDDA